MKLICFDIDGTLLNTDGAGKRAIHRALVDVLGTAGPIEQLHFGGRTDGEIVLRLAEGAGVPCDEHSMQRVLDRYVGYLEGELGRAERATAVFDGVREILDVLEARHDCILALLTGNVVGGARLKLRSANLVPERFVVGAFGSDHHVRAELPAVALRRAREAGHQLAGSDVVIIGDTPADMQCGRGIGARAIGVATGAFTVEQLSEAGAYSAHEDLSDVGAVLDAIFA